jgi:hypothetical protein
MSEKHQCSRCKVFLCLLLHLSQLCESPLFHYWVLCVWHFWHLVCRVSRLAIALSCADVSITVCTYVAKHLLFPFYLKVSMFVGCLQLILDKLLQNVCLSLCLSLFLILYSPDLIKVWESSAVLLATNIRTLFVISASIFSREATDLAYCWRSTSRFDLLCSWGPEAFCSMV